MLTNELIITALASALDATELDIALSAIADELDDPTDLIDAIDASGAAPITARELRDQLL